MFKSHVRVRALAIYIGAIMLAFNMGDGSSAWSGAKALPSAQQDKRFTEYRRLLEKYSNELGPLGHSAQNEIEIILDSEKMKEIESRTGRTIGVILDDPFWLLLNDPVRFPNGKSGVYGRLLWKKSLGGIAGVAVMAITADGRVALNRNYRHATRSWEYELPRGGIEKGESAQEGALREVKEETGFIIKDLKPLGEMANDSGMTSGITSVYLANAGVRGNSSPEDSEAIAAVETFSLSDIRKGLMAGYLTLHTKDHSNGQVRDQKIRIPLRDSFLTFGMWQAEARGLLPKIIIQK